VKGRETGKVYVLFGSLAAAFSSPMNGLIKGDLTHKERGPVDEKISTNRPKKRGVSMLINAKRSKRYGDILINCFIFLARSFHTRAWDEQISRFVSFTEREREKVCVLKIGALPSFVVVGIIDRSERARAIAKGESII